jgi:hypothetical protein
MEMLAEKLIRRIAEKQIDRRLGPPQKRKNISPMHASLSRGATGFDRAQHGREVLLEASERPAFFLDEQTMLGAPTQGLKTVAARSGEDIAGDGARGIFVAQ